MKKRVTGYVLPGLILLLVFSFQRDLDHTRTLRAVSTSAEEGITEVTPGLSLPAGTFSLELGTYVKGTTDSAVVQFYSPEHGILLEQPVSNGIAVNPYTLTLTQPDNIVYIRILSTPETPVEVHTITVRGDKPLYRDTALFMLLFAVGWALFGWYYFGKKCPDESLVTVGILALGVLLASFPLFSDYLIEGHDLNFQLYRIEGIKDALRSGQFPVRVHPTHNNGYGYATAVLYPELFLYFPAILRLCGISIVNTFQIFLISVNVLTAMIAYYSIKDMTKSRYTATLFAFVYTVSSYRVACVIQRNAVGEILALAFLPLVIAGFYNLFEGEQKKWYQLVIGATGILQSHMIGTLLTLLFAVFICLCYFPRFFKEKRLLTAGKTLLVLVLVNLWYIVPFFDFYRLDLNLHHTTEGLSIFYNNAVFPAQLFQLMADHFGYSHNLNGGMGGEMSMSPGYLVTFVFAGGIIWYLIAKKDKKSYSFKIFGFGVLFLLGSTTLIPWQRLQGIGLVNTFTAVIQFPWRFLGIASAMFVCAGAFIGAQLEAKMTKQLKTVLLAATVLGGVITMSAFGTEAAQMDVYLEKAAAVPLKSTIGMNQEYLLDGTNPEELTAGKYITSGEEIVLTEMRKLGTTVTFDYQAETDGYVEVPLLWYPGYSAKTSDGEKLTVEDGDNHVLRVALPDTGRKTVEVTVAYTGKFKFHAAEIISLLTVAGCAAIAWRKRKL